MKNKWYPIPEGLQSYYHVPRLANFGRVESRTVWRASAHLHHSNSYECLLVTQGRVRVQIDTETFTASAGDFYFLLPGQKHAETSVRAPLYFFYLQFTLTDLRGKPVELLPSATPISRQIFPGQGALFRNTFEKIHEEVATTGPESRQIVESLILETVWRMKRLLRQALPNYDSVLDRQAQTVAQAKRFLDEHVEQAVSLDELARQCRLSPDYLGHIFKHWTGVAPLVYAARVRTEAAKRLLLETPLAISEIAYRLGYEDPAYFSRRFRRIAGLSPAQYRAKAESSK
jgi:AraC-like DNA-binding protein/mannose-6-phosphate isomerase-like protein (cupin superfamily)